MSSPDNVSFSVIWVQTKELNLCFPESPGESDSSLPGNQDHENSEPNEEGKQIENQMRIEKEKKHLALILATKRSLYTNFLVAFIIVLSTVLMILLPNPMKSYIMQVLCTFEKSILLVIATVGNFGAVQSIFSQYWHLIH